MAGCAHDSIAKVWPAVAAGTLLTEQSRRELDSGKNYVQNQQSNPVLTLALEQWEQRRSLVARMKAGHFFALARTELSVLKYEMTLRRPAVRFKKSGIP